MGFRLRRFYTENKMRGVVVLSVLAILAPVAMADRDRPPKIEVELTESFYRALSREGGGKTYSTDKSEEYLRQIAVSARYAVESNLKIIERQEHIIKLLEQIRDKRPATSRNAE